MAKIIFGIKKYETYVTNEKRVEYYKPYFETSENKVSIYAFKNWEGIQATSDSVHIPRIFVQNIATDSVYVLSCYEDIPYDVEEINNGKYDGISKADIKEFTNLKNIIDTSAVLTSTQNVINNNGKWKVYLVNGTFMGKKLRKRTLPITTINGLQEIIVVDISIDGERPKQ
ncbi:hypothetical protein FUA48_13245 [Flavobacterium alkalisoli]|uniref:Uncharacterized protein n=1 Tax=Flavobacterium alkalisoli TaxID=2602769 RepID=A0A5B9FUE3_9FLAO|nr:hypothetical protein [Flavobacterium alkalisoli]QEE50504.1 hypothetical protein FUA48_13245 [Flavobacterium alkalisoli]